MVICLKKNRQIVIMVKYLCYYYGGLFFNYFQPPLEFRERMLQSCKERSVMLQDYVETVMEGLQTVANILAVKKVSLVTEHSNIIEPTYIK